MCVYVCVHNMKKIEEKNGATALAVGWIISLWEGKDRLDCQVCNERQLESKTTPIHHVHYHPPIHPSACLLGFLCFFLLLLLLLLLVLRSCFVICLTQTRMQYNYLYTTHTNIGGAKHAAPGISEMVVFPRHNITRVAHSHSVKLRRSRVVCVCVFVRALCCLFHSVPSHLFLLSSLSFLAFCVFLSSSVQVVSLPHPPPSRMQLAVSLTPPAPGPGRRVCEGSCERKCRVSLRRM